MGKYTNPCKGWECSGSIVSLAHILFSTHSTIKFNSTQIYFFGSLTAWYCRPTSIRYCIQSASTSSVSLLYFKVYICMNVLMLKRWLSRLFFTFFSLSSSQGRSIPPPQPQTTLSWMLRYIIQLYVCSNSNPGKYSPQLKILIFEHHPENHI